MRNGKIIGVKDEQPGVRWIAKADLQWLTHAGRKGVRVMGSHFPLAARFHERKK
jgi:hypothetical protein